jgi:hypothetical protein
MFLLSHRVRPSRQQESGDTEGYPHLIRLAPDLLYKLSH